MNVEEPCRKKQRKLVLVQRTITSFPQFTTGKHTKEPPCRPVGSFFAALPDEVLQKSIFPFLSVQDLTHLASSCHWITSQVDTYRGPLPHIVREELLPSKFVYSNDIPLLSSEVHHSQTFRFLLKTRRHRIVQVNIRLNNKLWTEILTRRENSVRVHELSDDERKTAFDFQICNQIKDAHGSFHRFNLFGLYAGSNFELTAWQTGVEEYDSDDDDIGTWPLGKEQDLRDCVLYYWVCVNRAIALAPNVCPNIHYIMSSYPLESEPLRSCVPSDFVFEPNKAQDRKFFSPWKYRPPNSVEEWHSYATRDLGGWREYEIHEIPWYRDWYPKPVRLNPSNLLASLPTPIFLQSLLPHLTLQDLSALSVACPTLSARLIDSLRQKIDFVPIRTAL